ncbi:MAG: hypothetical protein M1821_000260 [Bathelium mastoideum]|nr:MAG: hypothetical protein M1821_000260 [Bathelium mastoideum]
MAQQFSHSPILLFPSAFFGLIFIAFGLNALFRPDSALSFLFPPTPPSTLNSSPSGSHHANLTLSDQSLLNNLLLVYGARDIFMGVAIIANVVWGSRKALGGVLVAGSAVAAVDGWACLRQAPGGEWSHWGYAPLLTTTGLLLLGALDGKAGTRG